MSACTDDMIPRHGFSPQQGKCTETWKVTSIDDTAGSPPAEVVMDQEEMTPDMYLRWEEWKKKLQNKTILQGDNTEPNSL